MKAFYMKLIAATVFYNPKKNVIDNIKSYIDSVEKLIIVDNSETVDENIKNEIIDTLPEIDILYIANEKNFGIATALNIACSKAIELDYDYILLMDQDSSFVNFDSYLKCIESNNADDVAVHTANSGESDNTQLCEFEEHEKTITSSSILNLNIYQKIGPFLDKLFIDEVDFEYCLRANLHNYKVRFYPHHELNHNLGENNNRKRYKIQHNYMRRYYITRNRFYVSSLHGKHFEEYRMKTTLYQYLYRNSWKVLTREDDKLRKLKSIYLGFVDFLLNKYGKKEFDY